MAEQDKEKVRRHNTAVENIKFYRAQGMSEQVIKESQHLINGRMETIPEK